MLAVCDTTPLNYLIQIGQIDLIPRLYGNACIPGAVLKELQHPKAPAIVRQWALDLPDWISVKIVEEDVDPILLFLGIGEREAISVAELVKAEFFLTDDYQARAAARRRGIATLTTLLILDAAANRGWISFQEALDKLKRTNFRVNPETLAQLAKKHAPHGDA